VDRGEGAVGSKHAWVLGGADGALTLPACLALGMSPLVIPVLPAAPQLSPAQITGKNTEPRAAGDMLAGPGRCHHDGASSATPGSWAAPIK